MDEELRTFLDEHFAEVNRRIDANGTRLTVLETKIGNGILSRRDWELAREPITQRLDAGEKRMDSLSQRLWGAVLGVTIAILTGLVSLLRR